MEFTDPVYRIVTNTLCNEYILLITFEWSI